MWEEITQQEVIFMSDFLAKVLHYYSRYDFDSIKQKISKGLGPKKGPNPIFPYFASLSQDSRKTFS